MLDIKTHYTRSSKGADRLAVFYNPSQSIPPQQQANGFSSISPSAMKPSLVVNDWQRHHGDHIAVYGQGWKPLTESEISLAHDEEYVRGVMSRAIENGFGNTSKLVTDSLPWVHGSFYAAAEHALTENTVAASPTSGFHHAHWAMNHGFCTFNGLLVTAALLQKNHGISKIAIVDFDAHHGDGTMDIINTPQFREATQLSVANMSFGSEVLKVLLKKTGGNTTKAFGILSDDDWSVTHPTLNVSGSLFDDWCYSLESTLVDWLGALEPDIVMYQAGADPHIHDPLGGYLTTNQMIHRDETVFKVTKSMNLPVVWNLAGGYQRPVQKVVDLHRNTLIACLDKYLMTPVW